MAMKRWRSVRATPEERLHALPGDELIKEPIGSLDHAITIRRARREVWPWLAQMGAGSTFSSLVGRHPMAHAS